MVQTKQAPVAPLVALADAVATKKNIEKILDRKAQEYVREAFVKQLAVNAARNYVREQLQKFLQTRFFSDFQRSKTVGKLMAKYVGRAYGHRLKSAERALEAYRKRQGYVGYDERDKFFERFWDAFSGSA